MSQTAPAPAPAGVVAPAPKYRSRARFNRGMKLVRRAHLYAGLFMVPWVFLYGISGILFNHPDAFADQASSYFGGGAGAGVPTVDAAELAGRVVGAINGPDPAGGAAYRLIEPDRAEFARDLVATARSGERSYNVRVSLRDGSGSAREAAKKGGKPAPFATKAGLKLDPPPLEPVAKALPAALGRSGIAVEEASIRTAPDLVFFMEGGGRPWRVTYNAQTGAVTGRPASEMASPTARRSMQLLHVAHGFPSRINARWVWAIAVDVMGVSMVGWGLTGLIMWWQMKNVRIIGLVVLIASAIAAAAMTIGMHSAFVAEGLS